MSTAKTDRRQEDIYMRIVVEKYHGLGNDYLVFDPEHNGWN